MGEADGTASDKRIYSVARGLLLGEMAVLAITGLWLSKFYRPQGPSGFGEFPASDEHVWSDRVSLVHSAFGYLLLPATAIVVAALAIGLGHIAAWRRRIGKWLAAAALPAVAIGLVLSGWYLPWDQLALREITVGTNVQGYGFLLGDDALFALSGGSELSIGSLRVAFVAHAFVLPAALAMLLFLLDHWARSEGPDHEGDTEGHGSNRQDVVIAAS